MTHNFTILNDKKYFSKQFEWIERQIKSFKTDSFVDFELASIEIKNGNLTRYSGKKILWAFTSEFLSDVGLKRLNTAIKVSKKRSSDTQADRKKIEVVLDLVTRTELSTLAKKSGLTQTQIITQLINNEAKQINVFALK